MLTHRDRRATLPCAKSRPPLRGTPQSSTLWGPLRGRLEKAAGHVERLIRATSPACAVLLAGDLLQTIPAIAGVEYGPS